MKKALIALLALLVSAGVRAQNSSEMSNEIAQIETVINRLFVSTDQHNWDELKKIFDDSVELDYSSMTNLPGSMVTSGEIIAQWSAVLPGFEHTHHQIGNHLTEINGNSAHTFCYGTATHFLPHEEGDVWTVVGTYDFNLTKKENMWVITSMRFNFKYQTGNAKLVQVAIENQQAKQ